MCVEKVGRIGKLILGKGLAVKVGDKIVLERERRVVWVERERERERLFLCTAGESSNAVMDSVCFYYCHSDN